MRPRLLTTAACMSLILATAGLAVPAAAAATSLGIAIVQGTAKFSPYQGKKVTFDPPVVTAVYGNDSAGLRGFVMQAARTAT